MLSINIFKEFLLPLKKIGGCERSLNVNAVKFGFPKHRSFIKRGFIRAKKLWQIFEAEIFQTYDTVSSFHVSHKCMS